MRKATSKNVYHPEGNTAASKWRVTTTYNRMYDLGDRWICKLEKRSGQNPWRGIAVEYSIPSEKECLKWAENTIIMMQGVKS